MLRTYYPSGNVGNLYSRAVMNAAPEGADAPSMGTRHTVGDVSAYVALGTLGVAIGGMATATVAGAVRALRTKK